jgi:hypothetical protein
MALDLFLKDKMDAALGVSFDRQGGKVAVGLYVYIQCASVARNLPLVTV